MSPRRILHVINNLHLGGAETMLVQLLGCLDRERWTPEVVSLVGGGPASEQLESIGVPVTMVGMPRGLPGPATLLRLTRAVRRARPDLIQTWLYHSDLLGGLASRMAGRRAPVVWNLRRCRPTRGRDKPTTIWTARICARLSKRLPARIVANSQSGRQQHIELGYDARRIEVIPNGFDVNRFQPSETARHQIRDELGLSRDTPLVGMAARWDPLKDYPTMIAAASRLFAVKPGLHVLLCGPGIESSNSELSSVIDSTSGHNDWSDRLHLLGRRSDMPTWQAALDVAVLASCSEGFPNAVGEAMACGVPCVATDAGGTGEVLGDTGRLVGVGDADGLARAVADLLDQTPESRRELGLAGRERIVHEFALERMVERFDTTWTSVLAGESLPRHRGNEPETISINRAA
jgi:glycosyltransferase involved in cell wall biosynthesis